MAFRRTSIGAFSLANNAYSDASVSFYTVDADTGERTTTLATLYEGMTGSDTLANPQTLDSEGKFAVPVYADVQVIGVVSGSNAEDHETGVITPSLSTADVTAAAASATAAAASATAAATSAAAAEDAADTFATTATQSGNYTVLAADRGKVIVYTGAGGHTFTFDAAATLGADYFVTIRHDGSGALGIAPDSGETINGEDAVYLRPNEAITIASDGANLKVLSSYGYALKQRFGDHVPGWATNDIVIAAMRNVATATTEANTLRSQIQIEATSAVSGTSPISAIDGEFIVRSTNTQNWSSSIAMAAINAYISADTGSTGSIGYLAAFRSSGVWNGATADAFYHYEVSDLTGTGTITLEYGFYCPTLRGTTAYGFYAAADVTSVFGGDTSLGGLVGSEALRAVYGASYVNRVDVTGGATGVFPTIAAAGETNVDLNLAGAGNKGVAISNGYLNIQDSAGSNPSSGWYLDFNGGAARLAAPASSYFRFLTGYADEQMRVYFTAGSKNWVQVTGSVSGSAPSIIAEGDGTDTDVDLSLAGKGAGLVRFGAFTADGAISATGSISIKASNGTTYKLLAVAA